MLKVKTLKKPASPPPTGQLMKQVSKCASADRYRRVRKRVRKGHGNKLEGRESF